MSSPCRPAFGFDTFSGIGQSVLDLKVPHSEFSLKYWRDNCEAAITIPQATPLLSHFHSAFQDPTFGDVAVDLSADGRRLSFSPSIDGHRPSISLTIPKPRRYLLEHTLAFGVGPLRAELRTLQTQKALSSLCQLSARFPHFTCQALFPSFTGSLEFSGRALRLFASRKANAVSARVEAQEPTAEPRGRIFAEGEIKSQTLSHALVGFCFAIPPADVGVTYDAIEQITTLKMGWQERWLQPAMSVVKGKNGGSIAIGIRAARSGSALTAKYDSLAGWVIAWDWEIDELTFAVAVAGAPPNFTAARLKVSLLVTE